MASTKTASGLEIEELIPGEGDVATAGRYVTVHYTGWLTNGSKFDSSKDRDDAFRFGLGQGQVIRGWDEGVQGMKVGGKRKLTIPPELGYGARGAGGHVGTMSVPDWADEARRAERWAGLQHSLAAIAAAARSAGLDYLLVEDAPPAAE